MGTIGHGVANLFDFASSAERVVEFINGPELDSNISVVRHGDRWAVLTGDQALFEGGSVRECEDFLFGVLVGGTIFPDLAQHPRWRDAFSASRHVTEDVAMELPEAFAAAWPDVRAMFEDIADDLQRVADVETSRFINANGPFPDEHYGAELAILRDITLQINADAEVTLRCGHPDRLSLSGPSGPAGEPVPFSVRLTVWIAGFELTALDMETLPPLSDAAEHEAALREYVRRGREFLTAKMPAIRAAFLAALAVPPQG